MASSPKRIRKGSLVVLGCVIAASLASAAGIALAGAGGSHHRRATASPGKDPRVATVHAKDSPAVLPNVTYPAEGVDISAGAPSSPGHLAAAASSPRRVLWSFRRQQVPLGLPGETVSRRIPAINLRTVTEIHPVSLALTAGTPFTAWVLTYRNTSSPVFGHSKARNASGCTSIAIMDASAGVWTDFFQDCGKRG